MEWVNRSKANVPFLKIALQNDENIGRKYANAIR